MWFYLLILHVTVQQNMCLSKLMNIHAEQGILTEWSTIQKVRGTRVQNIHCMYKIRPSRREDISRHTLTSWGGTHTLVTGSIIPAETMVLARLLSVVWKKRSNTMNMWQGLVCPRGVQNLVVTCTWAHDSYNVHTWSYHTGSYYIRIWSYYGDIRT